MLAETIFAVGGVIMILLGTGLMLKALIGYDKTAHNGYALIVGLIGSIFMLAGITAIVALVHQGG